ncbi:MAG: hypothetical protein Q4P66_01980 [Actinomycetaceae bacterium]|nr:hypothetical protein [Actinomycetaceae bacterium]
MTEFISPQPIAADLHKKLLSVETATLATILRKKGINNAVIEGLCTTQPGKKICGVARTLRYIPAREDLQGGGGPYNIQKQLIDQVGEGEILVIEARGNIQAGTLGDMMALRMKVHGAQGVITDGCIRDMEEITSIGLPVFSAGVHPAQPPRMHIPWDADLTISCGNTAVQPGDYIMADQNGIIVLAPSMAEEVVEEAIAHEKKEEFIVMQLQAGHPIKGLIPMDEQMKAAFEQFIKQG